MERTILQKSISKDNALSLNSQPFQVNDNTKYSVTTEVTISKGQPFSGYFVVIMMDNLNREIGRHICWLNTINNPKKYTLTFTTKPKTNFLILGYRINVETPVKSDVEIKLQDLSTIEIRTSNENEQYDDITQYTVPLIKPLSNDEELEIEKKIVWLYAPPRSGTTWLGSRLLNHPSNIIWNEPWIGLHLGLLRGALMPAQDFDNKKYKFERVIDQQSVNGDYFFSPHHKNNWLPSIRTLLLTRTFSQVQTFTKNIIIKDPVGSNGTDILLEALPNSKIIFLVRDGRDEVDSRMDMHRPGSWAKLRPLLTPKSRLDAINYYSHLWVVNMNNIKRGFDNHNSKLKILIKYEELKKNTFNELKRIYDFIGVKISEEELQNLIQLYDFKNIPDSEKGVGKFNRSAKLGGWIENFNKEERNLMNSIMGQTLKKFGYSV